MKGRHTTEGDAGGGDNAGLDDGVFLPGEGLLQQAGLPKQFGPRLDEEEAQ